MRALQDDALKPAYYSDLEQCASFIIDTVGSRIVLGLPLGIGKPNQLVNALFRRACADNKLQLTIITALSLQPPRASSLPEKRFLDPISRRLYGEYPPLEYADALGSGRLPQNINVIEFYVRPGAYLNNARAQRNILSSNYTHAVRDLLALGVNVIVQSVAQATVDGRIYYSLACNPDITLDLLAAPRPDNAARIFLIGQVNTRLPFMGTEARLQPDAFDAILAGDTYNHEPFSTINMPVDNVEHMIGLYASRLIRDGGTLQLGIGEISDAVAHSLTLRHSNNAAYLRALSAASAAEKFGPVIAATGGSGVFSRGLYGMTELLGDALWFLYRKGIIKRKVYPHALIQRLVDAGMIGDYLNPDVWQYLLDAGMNPCIGPDEFSALQKIGVFKAGVQYENGYIVAQGTRVPADLGGHRDFFNHCLGEKLENGTVIDAAFCLGSREFYRAMRDLGDGAPDIRMRPVSFTNELYGTDYPVKCAQRRHARFINSGLKATLTGAIVSDGLANGQVISGVGGQYNFIDMAHTLPDARSILTIRSTRGQGAALESNIIWNYGHITIPRHLRDIVVTEYGIADLRSRTDEMIIIELLKIADSRFQPGLLKTAQQAGKLRRDYRLPPEFCNNYPQAIARMLDRERAHFPEYPLGTDFTAEEQSLLPALENLKALKRDKRALLKTLLRAAVLGHIPERLNPLLARMQLQNPRDLRERLWRRLLAQQLLELENSQDLSQRRRVAGQRRE
jgi:acyl-CoA hydrolase